MDLHQVCNNIKLLRRLKGITQKDIAARLFMDERTYSKIERGEKKSIDIRLLTSIADILETDIVVLLRASGAVPTVADTHTPTDPDLREQIVTMQQTQGMLMEVIQNMQDKISKLVSANHAVLELLRHPA